MLLGARTDERIYLQSKTTLLLVEALRFADNAKWDSILREGEGECQACRTCTSLCQ